MSSYRDFTFYSPEGSSSKNNKNNENNNYYDSKSDRNPYDHFDHEKENMSGSDKELESRSELFSKVDVSTIIGDDDNTNHRNIDTPEEDDTDKTDDFTLSNFSIYRQQLQHEQQSSSSPAEEQTQEFKISHSFSPGNVSAISSTRSKNKRPYFMVEPHNETENDLHNVVNNTRPFEISQKNQHSPSPHEPQPKNQAFYASLSKHILAYKTNVIGLTEDTEMISSSDQIIGHKWNTTFAPHNVCHIASSENGVLAVASTQNGVVSILNGSNGEVLAQRQVQVGAQTGRSFFAAQVQFVSKLPNTEISVRESCGDNQCDAAVIFTPPPPSSCTNIATPASNNTYTSYNVHQEQYQDPIIVSGLDGLSLTSSNQNEVLLAAQKMSIDVLPFKREQTTSTMTTDSPLSTNNNNEDAKNQSFSSNTISSSIFPQKMAAVSNEKVSTMCSYFITPNLIRFLICNQKGQLFVYDYDLLDKTSSLVKSNLLISLKDVEDTAKNIEEGEEWLCLQEAGIKVDTYCTSAPLLVFAVTKTSSRTNSNDNKMSRYYRNNKRMKTQHQHKSDIKVCWMNALTLDLLCEYSLSSTSPLNGDSLSRPLDENHYDDVQQNQQDNNKSHIILALEPLPTCSSSTASAVCIALGKQTSSKQPSLSNGVEFHVIQVLVSSAEEVNHITKLSSPHLLYRIPYQTQLQHKQQLSRKESNNALCLDIAAVENSEYSFTYTVVVRNEESSMEHQQLKRFRPSSPLVGAFRLLLAKEKYEEAFELISAQRHSNSNLEYDSIESMHVSEVAVWQLRSVLYNTNNDNDEEDKTLAARDCLKRLVSGTVSGGEIGLRCLLTASHIVSTWATNKATNVNQTSTQPQIIELRKALSGILSAIEKAMEIVPTKFIPVLKLERQKLKNQIFTVNILKEVFQQHYQQHSDNNNKKTHDEVIHLDSQQTTHHQSDRITLVLPLAKALSSPTDLYRTLIAHGHLKVAEYVRKSAKNNVQYSFDQKSITHEFMVLCVLDLPLSLDPRSYSVWLKDLLLGLNPFNQQKLLREIRCWACHCANVFDRRNKTFSTSEGEEDGLSSSIVLLKTVCEATAKLSTRIHNESYMKSFPTSSHNKNLLSSSLSNNKNDMNHSHHITHTSRSVNDSILSSLTMSPLHNNNNRESHEQKNKIAGRNNLSNNPSLLQTNDFDDLRQSAKRRKPALTITIPEANTAIDSQPLTTTSKSDREKEAFSKFPCSDDDEEEEDGEEHDCEAKLVCALNLLQARKVGLPKKRVCLDNYVDLGGSSYIARELIRHYLSSSEYDKATKKEENSHCEDRIKRIERHVKPFCEDSEISFDDVISQYTTELCNNGKGNSPSDLVDASLLVRCCDSHLVKCEVTLRILRAALLCSDIPSSLETLSNDAKEWARNHREIKSELEEAARLLMIDSIVRRYCGNGAQEFFRVTDPQHATRLLRHVTRFIDDPNSLTDVLALCDSFVHLSKVSASVLMLQHILVAPEETKGSIVDKTKDKESDTIFSYRAKQSASVMDKLFAIDEDVAFGAGSRILVFCTQLLNEYNLSIQQDSIQQKAIRVSLAAQCILKVMNEHASNAKRYNVSSGCPFTNWESLQRDFHRIHTLQTTFKKFLTISDLHDDTVKKSVALELLTPVKKVLLLPDHDINRKRILKQLITKVRRGCELIYGNDRKKSIRFWFEVVGSTASSMVYSSDVIQAFELLDMVGMLDDSNGQVTSQELVKVAKALCDKASRDAHDLARNINQISSTGSLPDAMSYVLRASSLLQEHSLTSCSDDDLSSIVSMSGLVGMISQALLRSDGETGEQIDEFRKKLEAINKSRRQPFMKLGSTEDNLYGKSSDLRGSALPPLSCLHPHFYIGDGLLLPPLEIICYCMSHCSKHMRFSNNSQNMEIASIDINESLPDDIFSFLSSRGAWGTSLTMFLSSRLFTICNNSSVSLRENTEFDRKPSEFYYDMIQCLSERSLGSSRRGIISGVVDSQLAVSYLLSLPIKQAFKVFRSALPSAISKRDYEKVFTLANIGVKIGTESVRVKWKNQASFVNQCNNLSSNALWWQILENTGVSFDPRGFGEVFGSTDKSATASRIEYATSLVPDLISKSSKIIPSVEQVLHLSTEFAENFGVDVNVAPQKMVEFLMSWPDMKSLRDIRRCSEATQNVLQLLPSSMARSAVLRKCVISMESNASSGTDYERHNKLLSFYYSELKKVLLEQTDAKQSYIMAFKQEIARLESRQEVLTILMHVFKEHESRPSYPSFFIPLPFPFGSDRGKPQRKICGILGKNDESNSSSSLPEFDPISSLSEVLQKDKNGTVVAALSPLCHSLGLPVGYIHGRYLYIQMLYAKQRGSSLPSFEHSVLSDIQRLQSADDGAELAEWISSQYEKGSVDRLKCLHYALSLAMKASCDFEQRQCENNNIEDDSALTEKVANALARVKRIKEAYSVLADKIEVETIFNSFSSSLSPETRSILNELVEMIQIPLSQGKFIAPEELVKMLISEGSHLAAARSLDETSGFSFSYFRKVAFVIHEACKAISDSHSHVNVEKCSENLARRWLAHGDEIPFTFGATEEKNNRDESFMVSDASFREQQKPSKNIEVSTFDDEDETKEFEMDLNIITNNDQFWHDMGQDKHLKLMDHVSEMEEPDAIKKLGSRREQSDFLHARVSLRIAFAISLSSGYFSSPSSKQAFENSPQSTENETQTFFFKTGIESKTQDRVLEIQAREMLDVVFAKSQLDTQSKKTMDSSRSPLKPLSSNVSDTTNIRSGKGSTVSATESLTFAMRYRALRAVLVLCPLDVIVSVMTERNYIENFTTVGTMSNGFQNESNMHTILEKISFGLFLSMEIEAMKLPLPHSDLKQLSTMNFSSYARALWRHHGRTQCQGFKGRLLRLLLELCLKDNKIGDGSLVVLILEEILKYDLPRTLLSACELLGEVKSDLINDKIMLNERGKQAIQQSLLTCTSSFLKEIQKKRPSVELSENDCRFTLSRIKNIVSVLGSQVFGDESTLNFIEALLKLSSILSESRPSISSILLDATVDLICGVKDCDGNRVVIFEKILRIDQGKASVERIFGSPGNISSVAETSDTEISNELTSKDVVKRIENSLKNDLQIALRNVETQKMTEID